MGRLDKVADDVARRDKATARGPASPSLRAITSTDAELPPPSAVLTAVPARQGITRVLAPPAPPQSSAAGAPPAMGIAAGVTPEGGTPESSPPTASPAGTLSNEPDELSEPGMDPGALGAALPVGEHSQRAPGTTENLALRRRRGGSDTVAHKDFPGELLADGFPLPRGGEAGQLCGGEELPKVALRLSPVLHRALVSVKAGEAQRQGTPFPLERLIDCALLLIPDKPEAVAAFVASAPAAVIAEGTMHVIGSRIRPTQQKRLGAMKDQLIVAGLPALSLAKLHRSAVWHYCIGYAQRFHVQLPADLPGQ